MLERLLGIKWEKHQKHQREQQPSNRKVSETNMWLQYETQSAQTGGRQAPQTQPSAEGGALQSREEISKLQVILLLREQEERLVYETQINENIRGEIQAAKSEKYDLKNRLFETEKLKVKAELNVSDLELRCQAQSEKTKEVEACVQRLLDRKSKLTATLSQSMDRWEQEEPSYMLEQEHTVLQLRDKITALGNRITELERKPLMSGRFHNLRKGLRLWIQERVKSSSLRKRFCGLFKSKGTLEIDPSSLQFPP